MRFDYRFIVFVIFIAMPSPMYGINTIVGAPLVGALSSQDATIAANENQGNHKGCPYDVTVGRG